MQPGSWTSPRLLLCLLCTVLCVGSFMPGPRLTCVLTSVHISTNPTPSHQAVNRDRRTRCCSSATALQIGQQEAHHLYSSKDCERPEQEPCSMRLRGGGVSLLLGRWSLPSLLFSNSRLALLPPSLTTTTRSIGTSMLSQQVRRVRASVVWVGDTSIARRVGGSSAGHQQEGMRGWRVVSLTRAVH